MSTDALGTEAALSGIHKAAILLVSLGAEQSAQVIRALSEDEVERLGLEISRLAAISPAVRNTVLQEFAAMADANATISRGGPEYASEVLQLVMGPKKSREVMDRVRQQMPQAPFGIIKRADPKIALDFIRREHPQTIALVLANLEPEQSAQILAGLPEDLRPEVVLRIAAMDTTSPEVLQQIDGVLEQRFSASVGQEVTLSGGAPTVAEILNRLDRGTEQNLFAALQEYDTQLAEEIRGRMFTFDDIANVDDRGVQRLLKEIEQRDLVLALKSASPEVTKKIFKNMSERAGALAKEEVSFLGPVRRRDVEEAQRRIIDAVRRLEEQGQMLIEGRGGKDDVVV